MFKSTAELVGFAADTPIDSTALEWLKMQALVRIAAELAQISETLSTALPREADGSPA